MPQTSPSCRRCCGGTTARRPAPRRPRNGPGLVLWSRPWPLYSGPAEGRLSTGLASGLRALSDPQRTRRRDGRQEHADLVAGHGAPVEQGGGQDPDVSTPLNHQRPRPLPEPVEIALGPVLKPGGLKRKKREVPAAQGFLPRSRKSFAVSFAASVLIPPSYRVAE
jgi:hypothetical protein